MICSAGVPDAGLERIMPEQEGPANPATRAPGRTEVQCFVESGGANAEEHSPDRAAPACGRAEAWRRERDAAARRRSLRRRRAGGRHRRVRHSSGTASRRDGPCTLRLHHRGDRHARSRETCAGDPTSSMRRPPPSPYSSVSEAAGRGVVAVAAVSFVVGCVR